MISGRSDLGPRGRGLWVMFAALAMPVSAQRGDRANEVQVAMPADLEVPPAVVRDPAAQLATFRLAPGFACELYAAEPLVGDPVAAAFDAGGRLWVVEMRGYMLDLEAKDERQASGRIVVLEDADGDGRADRSMVFRDGLVLPRAVLPLRGGALVVAPPELLWLPDADGDGRADGAQVIAGGFDAGLDNPEHSGNGLLWGLDNRIHLANDQRLWRWTPSGLVLEPGAGGGQWGITQDDRGRLYFNYNEDWLRCDLVPGRYGPRASSVGGLPTLNHRVCADRTVWPIRRTPGVNRGYQAGRLVDWVLTIHTAVCAPHVYRGGLLGCDGDVFVCEPAGHVVRRIVLQDHDGRLRGQNAYEAQRSEFLASTDERCRPVNLLTGPDGALYVVDMYRGVIQHRNFVTSFLRRQIKQRGLEQPTGLGRIWRIFPDQARPVSAPPLHAASVPELVEALAHGNGAVRDLALRELVQRQEHAAADPLRQRLATDARPAVRIVLLAALQGLDRLNSTDVRRALRDADPGVVAFALQHAAAFVAAGDGHIWHWYETVAEGASASVRWQAALTLGDALARVAEAKRRARLLAMLVRLTAGVDDDEALLAAIAVAAQAELATVLEAVVAAASTDPSGSTGRTTGELARRITVGRDAACQLRVLTLVNGVAPALARDLLRGVVAALPKGPARSGWLEFASTPSALIDLSQSADPTLARLAHDVLGAVAIVGTGTASSTAVAELTAAEAERVRVGERVYQRACAACHQLDGAGMSGLAPPLRDSEWVLGPADRLVRLVLHGLRGPIEVQGSTWSQEMPGQGQLSDDQIAQALSYLRRAFGHRATPIDALRIAGVRKEHAGRAEPWTAAELLGTK